MERTRADAVRRQWTTFLIPAVYLLIAIAVTFPFVLHPKTTLTAPLTADVAGSVSKYQTLVREGKSPFEGAHLATVGYPNGVRLPAGIDRISVLLTGFLWGLSLLFGPVAAQGILAILGFSLTAIITFLFVRRVTGSNGAGLVAGVAYGFWPHMYLIAAAAPGYTHMWMYILPVWAWFELARAPTPIRGLTAGLAALVAMFWTPYYFLHVLVIVGVCSLIVVLRAVILRQVSGRVLASFGFGLAVPMLAVFAITGVLALSNQSGVPSRPLEDAYAESAHPLMYLLPGHASIWGPGPYNLLVRLVPRAANVNSYLGISVIVLSIVAAVAALVSWARQRSAALLAPTVIATLLGGGVAVACFLFSLPPRLAAGRIPMPDALVIAVAPAFRGGQRFVMPLMGGMAIMAGVATSIILRRIPSARAGAAIALVLAMVVGLDLFARPTNGITGQPEATSPIPRSAALATLRMQPPGPAFEFIDHRYASPISNINPCLLQPQHDKTLVDTCLLAPERSDWVRWDASRSCDSLDDMRSKGVRYVIVDRVLAELTACDKDPAAGVVHQVAADDLFVVYRLD